MIKNLFWPQIPPYTEDEVQHRTARILNVLLILTVALTIASAILQGLYAPKANRLFNVISNALEAAIAVGLLFWLRKGGLRPVSHLLVLAAYLASTYPLAAYADIGVGPAVFAYVVVIGLSVLLLSPWETAGVFAIIAVTFPLIQMGIDSGTLVPSLARPDPRSMIFSYITILGIGGTALTLAAYNLTSSLEHERESLAAARLANEKLQQINTDLETIVAERTQELEEQTLSLRQLSAQEEKRARQLEAIAQIARATLQESNDTHTLLTRIANLIHQHFGFYHVGIFLLDDDNRYAVLQAVNSQSAGGQAMLTRQHKLFIGQTGIVGAVAASGLPRVVLDTSSDAVYFDNPDLPNTRAEIALPLIVRRRVIGVLDIQSTEPNAFTEDDVHIFAILADQIAYMLANSRRLQEAERLAREASLIYGETLQQGWRALARRHQIAGVQRRAGYKSYIGKAREYPPEVQQALQKQPYYRHGEQMLVPIRLRGQVVGVIEIESPIINDDLLAVAQDIAERVALATENIRLLEDARERADRERRISAFSAQLASSVNVQNILRIAAEEIGQILPGSEVTVQFATVKNGAEDA